MMNAIDLPIYVRRCRLNGIHHVNISTPLLRKRRLRMEKISRIRKSIDRNNNGKPRIHNHVVPSSYLANWANSAGYLIAYRRVHETKIDRKKKHINATGYVDGIYGFNDADRFNDIFERYLAEEHEHKYSAILKLFQRNDIEVTQLCECKTRLIQIIGMLSLRDYTHFSDTHEQLFNSAATLKNDCEISNVDHVLSAALGRENLSSESLFYEVILPTMSDNLASHMSTKFRWLTVVKGGGSKQKLLTGLAPIAYFELDSVPLYCVPMSPDWCIILHNNPLFLEDIHVEDLWYIINMNILKKSSSMFFAPLGHEQTHVLNNSGLGEFIGSDT